MPETDTMLERVRKLLAKAEDPSISPVEAEAYNAKAAELIARYGIERARLEETDPQRRATVADKIIRLQRPYVINKSMLLTVVGNAMRCKVITLRNDSAHVVGYESDIERVEIIFSSLLVQQSMGLSLAQMTERRGEDPRTFAKSYFAGFAVAVERRLRAAEKQAESEATTGTDLALVNRNAVVFQKMTELYPRTRATASRPVRMNGGYTRGHSDGSRANLGVNSLGKTQRGIES